MKQFRLLLAAVSCLGIFPPGAAADVFRPPQQDERITFVPDRESERRQDGLGDFWKALNNRVLKEEMERRENFPAFLYRRGSRHRVGRFFVGGRLPTGHMACRHLRLHRGQSEDLLTWEERNTAASNVFFHAHQAMRYFQWLSRATGEAVGKLDQPVDIRVEMDVEWAMFIRFAKLHAFNMALTTPEGEIWFHVPAQEYMPWVTRYIPGIRDTHLGTIGFPLDSARVPSLIYHEWTHLMTAPYLGVNASTVINEGYSNYFGSVIGGRPSMAEAGDFSSYPYRGRFDGPLWPITPDEASDSHNPFIPTLLWKLRTDYFGATRTDVLAWRALKFLSATASLRDFGQALLRASESSFSEEERSRLKKLLDHTLSRI